jgi:hypothetical protein
MAGVVHGNFRLPVCMFFEHDLCMLQHRTSGVRVFIDLSMHILILKTPQNNFCSDRSIRIMPCFGLISWDYLFNFCNLGKLAGFLLYTVWGWTVERWVYGLLSCLLDMARKRLAFSIIPYSAGSSLRRPSHITAGQVHCQKKPGKISVKISHILNKQHYHNCQCDLAFYEGEQKLCLAFWVRVMNKISDHLEVYSRPEKVSGFACNTLYVCMYVLGPYAAYSNHCGHLHRSRGVMVCWIGCGGEGG